MKKFAIVGANEFQKVLIDKVQSMGFETHVFAWQCGDVGEEAADYFYPISITDCEAILKECDGIGIDAIASIASDLANITVNYVAEKLGLPGNGIEATKLSTDKFLMRNRLNEASLPIPEYRLVGSYDEVDVENLGFPAIVKPIDRSGSRGITKVESIAGLKSAISFAQVESFTTQVLIEEFIEGTEFSVEAISYNGHHRVLQITEKFTSGSPNFIEKGHIAPARLADSLRRELNEIVVDCLDVLGVRNGASHSELKITPDGRVVIIEVGSRMGGDFIGSFLVESNTGFDFVRATVDCALGMPPQVDDLKFEGSSSHTSIVCYFFSEETLSLFERSEFSARATLIVNRHYTGTISSSAERLGCALIKLRNAELDGFLEKFKMIPE